MSDAAGRWSGLALQVSDDAALIGPEAAAVLVRSMAASARALQRNGIHPPPAYRTLLEVLARVAEAGSGHPDVRHEVTSAGSWMVEEIGTEQAAQLLGTSREHANRLARAGHLGPTRKAGNRRLVDRIHTEAYAAARKDHPR